MRAITIIIVILFFPKIAHAWQVGVGFGFAERGDERTMATTRISVQLKDALRSSLFIFGYNQKPVSQRYAIFTTAKPFQILKNKNLIANIGLGASVKQTSIDQTRNSINDVGFNFGVHFGILYQVEITKKTRFTAEWNQMLMPVGFSSILLTSARFQSFSLGVEQVL